MDLTYQEKIQTRHIWERCLSSDRVQLAKEFTAKHPGVITPSIEWSDMLCLRIETIEKIISEAQ